MKTNEDIIDFGEWKVPTKWEDVTLKQYQEIEEYYSDKERKFDVRDVIHRFCGKTKDEINALPSEFLETIMVNLSFLQSQPEEKKPTNKITVNGDEYIINTQNKLKVGEYIAADTVLKTDKHNYAAILGVLCRKDGEVYDSKFENEVLDDRIRMFESVPVVDVLPIISFFLHLYIVLQTPSQLSSSIREGLEHTRKNIEISARNGEISKRSMKSAMRKLTKLERYLDNI